MHAASEQDATRKQIRGYLSIALGAGGLFLVQSFRSMSLNFGVLLVACMSFVVFSVTKKKFRIAETFPELLRLPFMRPLA